MAFSKLEAAILALVELALSALAPNKLISSIYALLKFTSDILIDEWSLRY
ncbi:MAG: hypothetical protein MTP17_03725 [Candidatus Midichloria sp.]|nr:MAG: hypothetical protein MTP17_03725 [Candidatus Midichloria sp.]